MITQCFPFMKYVYIAILFIFVFLCLFNPHLTILGFGGLFGVQTIFTLLVCFDVFMDNNRGLKSLVMQIPENNYLPSQTILFPLWFVIIPSVIMQFISSLMMVMTYSYLKKNKKEPNISRSNEMKINNYKLMSILLTYIIIVLLYVYFNNYVDESSALNFSGGYKLFVFLFCFVAIILAVINLVIANTLSKLRFQSTSG